jgi:hypothetical protein
MTLPAEWVRLKKAAEKYVTNAGLCLEHRHGEECHQETLEIYLGEFRTALAAVEALKPEPEVERVELLSVETSDEQWAIIATNGKRFSWRDGPKLGAWSFCAERPIPEKPKEPTNAELADDVERFAELATDHWTPKLVEAARRLREV